MLPDLFQHDSPAKCGFEDFWSRLPQGSKSGKREAEKAYRRLTPPRRAEARDNVAAYYAWWRKTNPDASWLHPSTYLNQRRWEDEAWRPQATVQVDRAAFWADVINNNGFANVATCSPQLCREMIARGLVTAEKIKERGLFT